MGIIQYAQNQYNKISVNPINKCVTLCEFNAVLFFGSGFKDNEKSALWNPKSSIKVEL